MYAMHQNFGTGRGASAYAQLDMESSTMSANPHQLIVMLFDGADRHIRMAGIHMESGDIPAKGRAVSRAIDIVNQGLLASLDIEKGGEIAGNLANIYEYITRLLLQANRSNDQEVLLQARNLLAEIGSAWRQISKTEGEK